VNVLKFLSGATAIIAAFFVFGLLRQVMNSGECLPGKPDMSVIGIALAGIGTPTCIIPNGDNPARETRASQPRFHGFACTVDCSGHEAGYRWAQAHAIDDPHTCYSGPRLSNTANESFSEGCEAYVDDSTGVAPLGPSERH
jgi:hypothetical protein